MSLLINHFYRFGEFTLDADQKVLLRHGKPWFWRRRFLKRS
jgi:hypothetical protein